MGCRTPILRLRRDQLLRVALRVFGDEARAKSWLRAPHPGLEGASPDVAAETQHGFELALFELGAVAIDLQSS